MATEFQRACQALERLQESIARLAPEEAEEPSWVVLSTCGAAERSISAPWPPLRCVFGLRRTSVGRSWKLRRSASAPRRAIGLKLRLEELQVLVQKMRKKCSAHEELCRLSQEGQGREVLCRMAELQGGLRLWAKNSEQVVPPMAGPCSKRSARC